MTSSIVMARNPCAEPLKRIAKRVLNRTCRVSELAFRLGRGEKHLVLRHPEAIECDERLAPRDVRRRFLRRVPPDK